MTTHIPMAAVWISITCCMTNADTCNWRCRIRATRSAAIIKCK